jgi:hypothetical protein
VAPVLDKNGQSLEALKDNLQNICRNFKQVHADDFPLKGDNQDGACSRNIWAQQEIACEKEPAL